MNAHGVSRINYFQIVSLNNHTVPLSHLVIETLSVYTLLILLNILAHTFSRNILKSGIKTNLKPVKTVLENY